MESPPPEACRDLSRALARLPWSGEWLVRVLDGMPDPVASRARELAAVWQVRRNVFVEAHLGLVTFVVLRHGSLSGIAREDLIQEGRLALCRAVERYDPERGPRFSSYAVLVIRHAMAQQVRRMGVGPEAPRGPVPTVSGISPVPVDPGHGVGRRWIPTPVSLDAPLDDGTSLAERLPDTERLGPDVAAVHILARERLWEALAALPTEVERIVTLHWGLDGSPRRSIPSVARRVGRTPAEVEAVLRDALRVLRDLVARPPQGDRAAAVEGAPAIPADRRAPPGPWGASLTGSLRTNVGHGRGFVPIPQ